MKRMAARQRFVACAACGTRQLLAYDQPGVVAVLPVNWRRVGLRRDGSNILLCPACVAEAKKDPVETGSVSG